MLILDLLQTLLAASAVILGFVYIVGGLVVNLNLTRRGVVEFQILKVKYLVVGLIFLLHSIGSFSFAALPAIALLFFATNLLVMQFICIFSISASATLLWIWARVRSSQLSFWTRWSYWFMASVASALFPMIVFIRQLVLPSVEVTWLILTVEAVLVAALTFLAQIYHYSAFYYGRPSPAGALDPIGIGIPSRVRLACEPSYASLLQSLGVSVSKEHITQDLFLVDETDQHYIAAFERVPGQAGNDRTLKIDKGLVRAILFIPDPMRPPDPAPGEWRGKKQPALLPKKGKES
ncbi:MAG: hypothetical protein ACOYYS_15655 [Chloroflexota bacterium]